MKSFLDRVGVSLAGFRNYVLDVTCKVLAACLAKAESLKRPVIYLPSAATRKEDVARRALEESPIEEGLICVLKAVEPCKTYDLRGGRRSGRAWLESKFGKCLHLYHYFLDRRFGFMSARLQTWFPFTIQVWINGREWLHRRFLDQGVQGYVKEQNCFTELADPEQAQQLFDRLLDTSWQPALDDIAQRLNPIHGRLFELAPQRYYWSVFQSEWAVDILFKHARYLESLFPTLARHAITQMSCADVLRYLGRKADGRFQGEILGEFKSQGAPPGSLPSRPPQAPALPSSRATVRQGCTPPRSREPRPVRSQRLPQQGSRPPTRARTCTHQARAPTTQRQGHSSTCPPTSSWPHPKGARQPPLPCHPRRPPEDHRHAGRAPNLCQQAS
jgi:hypothetical protein